MSSAVATSKHTAPIRACTVSRDVQNFDLLIEDMELELGESWGDLTFPSALKFLDQPDARNLEFIAIALDDDDEANMAMVEAVIQRATSLSIRVLLIAEELGPIALHRLLRLGASDFVPYPLPEGALHDAILRLRQPAPDVANISPQSRMLTASAQQMGTAYAVQGLAGGSGATTFAVNLAWELAIVDKKAAPKVCLIDLDVQYGSCSTFLDLPRREAIYELLQDTSVMDQDAFMQALLPFNDKLQVFTAPYDMLPLDLITSEDVNRLIGMASRNFDYVVIDMPSTVVTWTEAVLNQAHVFFALIELDMRSAQNALRLLRAFRAEELPVEKLRFALNRSPGFTDSRISGCGR